MNRPDTEGRITPRRRVLVLIKCLDRGGAERLVVSMTQHGDRTRFDYEVAYVLDDQDALVPELERAGIPVHSLGARNDYDLRWTGRLRALLTRGNFDIVHSHLPYAAALGRLVAATVPPRVGLVYTEHCVWDQVARPTRVLNRLTIGLDDRVLAVSEASRQALPPAQRRRASVVVHGIELESIDEAVLRRVELRASVRAELGLADDEVLSLTVANFRAQKGYDVLLHAARAVVDRKVPVRFAAAGEGPLRRDLENQRSDLSLERHVLFLGARTDVPRLLAAADMFVLPSRYEGLPLALMEAVSIGVPVIATAVSGLPDILTNERNALLVAPEQPHALAEAITRLASDPALRASLSTASRTLSERFDVRRCVLEVEAIYDGLRPQSVPIPG